MIYLENKTQRQQVRIPYNGLWEDGEGEAALKIWSATDARTVRDAALDVLERGVFYLRGQVRLPADLPGGEYEYRLTRGAQTLSSGVCQIGAYAPVPVQKSDVTIKFKQYERKR